MPSFFPSTTIADEEEEEVGRGGGGMSTGRTVHFSSGSSASSLCVWVSVSSAEKVWRRKKGRVRAGEETMKKKSERETRG